MKRRLDVRRVSGSKKLHLIPSILSDETICGKKFISSEWISMYDYPFDLCQKCWAFVGKEMTDEYFGKERWDEIVKYCKENLS